VKERAGDEVPVVMPGYGDLIAVLAGDATHPRFEKLWAVIGRKADIRKFHNNGSANPSPNVGAKDVRPTPLCFLSSISVSLEYWLTFFGGIGNSQEFMQRAMAKGI
jgi:hypothetical protein